MPASWTIEPATGAESLPAGGDGEAWFTVTNRSNSHSRASVDVLHDDAADKSWFGVVDPHQDIDAGASRSFRVRVTIPTNPPARFWLQARVCSTEHGLAGGYAVSSRVLLAVEFALPGEDAGRLSVPVSVPDVVGREPYSALAALNAVGLGASIDGQVIHPGEVAVIGAVAGDGATGTVISQNPAAGKLAAEGEIVTLHLRVDFPLGPVQPSFPKI
jgi:hypothetical protein